MATAPRINKTAREELLKAHDAMMSGVMDIVESHLSKDERGRVWNLLDGYDMAIKTIADGVTLAEDVQHIAAFDAGVARFKAQIAAHVAEARRQLAGESGATA